MIMAAHPHNVDTVLVAGKAMKVTGRRLVHADLRRTVRALRAIAAAISD
ncbi:hypothetical protein [Streptomyces sp. UG1]